MTESAAYTAAMFVAFAIAMWINHRQSNEIFRLNRELLKAHDKATGLSLLLVHHGIHIPPPSDGDEKRPEH